MQMVHSQLTKSQRALCAYLNKPKEPDVLKENGIKMKPHHLGRFAFYLFAARAGLFRKGFLRREDYGIITMELRKMEKPVVEGCKPFIDTVVKRELYTDPQTREDMIEAKKAIETNEIDDALLERINHYAHAVQRDVFYRQETIACENMKGGYPIDRMRIIGRVSFLYEMMSISARSMIADAPGEKDRTAIAVLTGLLRCEQYRNAMEKFQREASNNLGRALFTPAENNAWNYLRKRLWKPNTRQHFFDALRFVKRQKQFERIEWLLDLHDDYAFRERIESPGKPYRIEASPFIEKPVGMPITNFCMAIYPEDREMKEAMKRINDPSFEHADGAAALVRLSILGDALILEEMQTDVPSLLRAGSKEEVLDAMIKGWTDMCFEAAKIFAGKAGFAEFYASTPYRMLDRYGGSMHPNKLRVYFEVMEKQGGELVHDDMGELNEIPQYFYRFEV